MNKLEAMFNLIHDKTCELKQNEGIFSCIMLVNIEHKIVFDPGKGSHAALVKSK